MNKRISSALKSLKRADLGAQSSSLLYLGNDLDASFDDFTNLRDKKDKKEAIPFKYNETIETGPNEGNFYRIPIIPSYHG